MFVVVIPMVDRNELTMDVSGAWVREVSPMLATSRLFSPKHLGGLSYEHDAYASENSNEKQIRLPPRQSG
tara:strand:- start:215 stop:424 length:210 start_codon:yes stop_codon:yes gene_type:complete